MCAYFHEYSNNDSFEAAHGANRLSTPRSMCEVRVYRVIIALASHCNRIASIVL